MNTCDECAHHGAERQGFCGVTGAVAWHDAPGCEQMAVRPAPALSLREAARAVLDNCVPSEARPGAGQRALEALARAVEAEKGGAK